MASLGEKEERALEYSLAKLFLRTFFLYDPRAATMSYQKVGMSHSGV